jgi:hypothetical protein
MLPAEGEHPCWGVQRNEHHQNKRKGPHGKPEPANAAVAREAQAVCVLFCWTIIAPIW